MSDKSFEEKLKEKAERQLTYESLDTLPETITAKIYGEPQIKQDNQKNECVFLELILENGKGVIQKYTKTSFKDLYESVKQAGGFKKLADNFHKWTKRETGQAKNERYFPEV